MADSSNDWVKPNDIMKLRKYKNIKKTVISKTSISYKHEPLTAPQNKTLIQTGKSDVSIKPLKRKNPFGCDSQTEQKVRAVVDSEDSVDKPDLQNSRLFQCIETCDKNKLQEPSVTPYLEKLDNEDIAEESNHKSEAKNNFNTGASLPEDWSLRSKLRFLITTSSLDKFWPIRGNDEAQGLADFVNKTENKDQKQLLQSHMMYWSYPNLPWLRLFPRMDAGRQKLDQEGIQHLNKNSESVLFNEWTDSMSSCYQNVKQDLCPYMYVCCQHMTVIFISASSSKIREVVALVTPTTRGLRKSLDDEGIEFDLPLITKKAKRFDEENIKEKSRSYVGDETNNDSGITEKKLEGGDDDDDDDDDEDDETWMEKLGLDKKRYQAKETWTPKNSHGEADDNYRLIDYRPSSTVRMVGMNSNAFFNFFVNSAHVVSTVGTLAGIPPTILAPSAFMNSSLRSMNIINKGELINNLENVVALKKSSIKRTLLEITGPILPENFRNICNFFASNCQSYSGAFTVLESSVPFNCFGTDILDEEKTEISENHNDTIMKLRNSALKSLEFSDSVFKWNDKQ